MPNDISLKMSVDTSSAQKSVKDVEAQIKKLNTTVKSKGSGALISDSDIRNFAKLNQELAKLNPELNKLIQTISKLNSRSGGTGGSGGGGGASGGTGGTGGLGGNLLSHGLRYLSAYNYMRWMSQGSDLIAQEERMSAPLGTRIGGYGSDFRRTRLDFGAVGRQYNHTAMESMLAGNLFMSQAGTRNWQQNLGNIFYAEKGLGLDQNYLAQTYGNFTKMAGGSTDLRNLSESIAGAIKKTGMQGREQELIDALTKLTQNDYQTKLSVSDQDRNNLLAMYSYLGTKDPALKGEKGAQLMGGLEGVVKSQDSEVMNMMGYGSKYKGVQGYWQLREKLAKGFTDPSNLKDLMTNLNRIKDPTIRKVWLDDKLQQQGINNPEFVDKLLSPDIQKDIMSGKITGDQLNQMLKSGQAALKSSVNNRMNSNEQQRAGNTNYKQDVQKALGEVKDNFTISFMKWIKDNFSPEAFAGLFTAGTAGTFLLKGKGAGLLAKGAKAGGILGKGSKALGALGDLAFPFALFGQLSNMWDDASTYFSPDKPSKQTQDLRNKVNSGIQKDIGNLLGLSYSGTPNFSYAIGNGSPTSARTLEAKQSEIFNKQFDILKKEEELLGKKNNAQQSGDLAKAITQLSSSNKELLNNFTTSTNNTIMRLSSIGGGFGGGGITKVSYASGGGSGNFLNMGLNDGYNMSADQVNAWINSKAPKTSILRGQGQAFVEASRRTGLDVRYLVAHAALESGWGTSAISRNKHNFFGIGAVDSNPYGGAHTWGSVADGIIGGAQWIQKNFTARGQNTLYSMNHSGSHSYASDPTWDSQIASIMAGAPSATLNVKVSGGIDGLNPVNNQAVAHSIVHKINQAPDLSYLFSRGVTGVTV